MRHPAVSIRGRDALHSVWIRRRGEKGTGRWDGEELGDHYAQNSDDFLQPYMHHATLVRDVQTEEETPESGFCVVRCIERPTDSRNCVTARQ